MTNSDAVLVAELQLCLSAGHTVALLDVRGAGAFAAGHIPGSVNLPFGELERRSGDLTASAPWLIVADDDAIARAAVVELRRLGCQADGYVQGGITAWAEAGHQLERMTQV